MTRAGLDEHKELLLRKLLREGILPIRTIAERVGCGTGTVMRRKKEMGFEVRTQVSQRVTNLLASRTIPEEPEPDPGPAPSLAARRLAAFDPIVARSLAARTTEEPEDD